VATSYLVLIAYFDVGFIRILLRDYTKILQIADARDLHFSAYLMFLLMQMGVIVGVAAHECTCNSKCGVCCRRCVAAKRERLDLKTVEGISLNTLRAASFDFCVFMRAVVVDDELEASRRRVSS
jgi:hypothetical protein